MCWLYQDGGRYVTVSLVYQSVEQLHNCALLDLNAPPQKVKLSFDDLRSMKDLLNRFDDAVNAYDADGCTNKRSNITANWKK